MDKKTKGYSRLGGGGLLIFGGWWLADKTITYAWESVLNLLTAGAGKTVTVDSFPWLNAVGVASMCGGILVLIWPWLKRLSGRITLNESRVKELIQTDLAALPQTPSIDSMNAIARIQAVEQRIAALQNLELRFNAFESGVEGSLKQLKRDNELEMALRITLIRLRRAKLEDFIEKLNILSAQHLKVDVPPKEPTDMMREWRKASNVRKAIERHTEEVSAMGLPSLAAEFQTIEQDIKSDAIFADVSKDNGRFNTVEEKREWEAQKRKIKVMQNLIKGELGRLGPAENDLSGLRIRKLPE